jgi:hypothetical protein
LTTCGETKIPVVRASATDNSLNPAVSDTKVAEILKPLFERTSKGTRITGDSAPVPDNVKRTVLPLVAPSIPALPSMELGKTERATVWLTVPRSITELFFV